MEQDDKRGTGQRRKDLFSADERSKFRKKNQDTTLAPPLVADKKHAEATQVPGQKTKRAIGFHRDEVPSPILADANRRGKGLDPRSRRIIWLAIAVVIAYFASVLLPNFVFNINNRDLSLAWFIGIFLNNVRNFTVFISGGGGYGGIDFTAVRMINVGLAGAALAVAGAAYQGSLKNQLASPSTLGVMQGAQFGNVIYLMLVTLGIASAYEVSGSTVVEQAQSVFGGMNIFEYIWAVYERSFYALAGSVVVVSIVLFVSWLAGHGRSSRVAMVVTGQVVASLIGSFIVVVRLYVQEYGTDSQLDALRYALASNFSEAFTLPSLVLIAVPVLTCIGIIIGLRNRLNLLAFDEAEALSMGIRTRRLKIVVVACCTIMTAVIVAFCGAVGYVGFLIPHLARRIIGPDFKYLLPASALLGAAFLMIAFYLFTAFQVPNGALSTVTSAFGIVMFIIVLFKQKRSGYASW